MEDFIARHEHEEYVKRMEQEHKGMNARIKDLEAEVKEITDLTISINNLALSVDSMAKEQKKQRELAIIHTNIVLTLLGCHQSYMMMIPLK